MDRYRADGTLAARQAFARAKGNQQFSRGLVSRRLSSLGRGGGAMAPPGKPALPASGNPKVLMIAIDFSDYPSSVPATTLQSMMFGDGDAANYPQESLRRYYERSSYGKLHIGGDVLGWYRAKNARSSYTNNAEGLIEEAMAYYDGQGQDFAQYDNDGDGQIDYLCIMWTGPDTGWGSFWWGWFSGGFGDPSYRIDGKSIGGFSWQWTQSDPMVVIHETGHALGLPDYYDYDPSRGPGGGLGGLDEMDANNSDHNGFSKWMLEWLTPTTVGSLAEARDMLLHPQSTVPEAVAVMPSMSATSLYSEWFLVENRSRFANDGRMPGDGLLIFHIDARLNSGGGFEYDNSYTDHKLIRVMEADGLEEIEKTGYANAGDFYKPGSEFTPSSTPNSSDYTGAPTTVIVDRITGDPAAYTAHVSVGTSPDLQVKFASEADTQFVGNHIYEPVPTALQTKGATLTGANSVGFVVRVRNDDIKARPLRIGSAATLDAGWSVAVSSGGTDVTAAVTAGTYNTAALAPGATADLDVVITAGDKAQSNTTAAYILKVFLDAADITVRDSVKMTSEVKIGIPGVPSIITPDAGLSTPTVPEFRMRAADPDGDTVHFTVEITQGALKLSYDSAEVASNVEATVTVPAGAGLTKGLVNWRARTTCSRGAASDWVSRSFSINQSPNLPDLVAPADGALVTEAPMLSVKATDPDNDPLRFRLTVLRSGATVATYDQTVSTVGWSKASYASGEAAEFTPTTGLAGGAYTWRAEVYDGSVWVGPSTARSLTVNHSPGAPDLLTPAEGGITNALPTLTFSAVDPEKSALKYRVTLGRAGETARVYDQTASTTGFSVASFTSGATASFTVPASDPLSSGTWTWSAEANDGFSWGAASASRTFLVNHPPAAPDVSSVPADAVSTPMPTYKMVLTDVDSPTGLKARIELKRDGQPFYTYDQTVDTAGWSSADTASGGAVSFRAAGQALAPGEYSWTATAFDGTFWGPVSAVRTFVVPVVDPYMLHWGVGTLGISAGDVSVTPASLGIGAAVIRTWDPDTQSWSNLSGNLASGMACFYRWDTSNTSFSVYGRRITGKATIGLKPGWNLVTPPVSHALPWSLANVKVLVAGTQLTLAQAIANRTVDSNAWAWQPSDANPFKGGYVAINDPSVVPGSPGTLEPFSSYWIYAFKVCSMVWEEANPGSPGKASPNAWGLSIKATGPEGADTALLGETSAPVTVDTVPPSPGGAPGVTVRTVANGSPRAVDLRQLGTGSQVWNIEVSVAPAATAQTITLAWPNVAQLPRRVQPVLVDTVSGARRAIRQSGPMTITAPAEGGTFRYRMEMLAQSGVLRIHGLQALPRRSVGGISFAYNLTADANVDVRILSTGHVVRRLTGVGRAAGLAQATWDGRDSAGTSVAAGQYLIEITARGTDGQVARAIIPALLTR